MGTWFSWKFSLKWRNWTVLDFGDLSIKKTKSSLYFTFHENPWSKFSYSIWIWQTYLGLAWVCGVVTFGMVSASEELNYVDGIFIFLNQVIAKILCWQHCYHLNQVIVRDSMECRIGRQYLCQVNLGFLE